MVELKLAGSEDLSELADFKDSKFLRQFWTSAAVTTAASEATTTSSTSASVAEPASSPSSTSTTTCLMTKSVSSHEGKHS